MIPKKIHYCWFGRKKIPYEVKKCIESWKNLMPDYEVVEWNENNFDVNCCGYVKEAYERKMWAFVSDYARFWILYNNGGIYLDTDVRILKPLNPLVEVGAFLGREQIRDGGMVAPGLGMAFEKGNLLCKEILKSYENELFIKLDGSNNLTTIVQRVTAILINKGFNTGEATDIIQVVSGVTIYPAEYLCPMGYDGVTVMSDNTYAIHLYHASWFAEEERIVFHFRRRINKIGKVLVNTTQKFIKLFGRKNN